MTKNTTVDSIDPDYSQEIRSNTSTIAQDHHDESNIRAKSLSKIRSIIEREFTVEVERKEKELATIDHRIHQTKSSLDKLRSYILAAYFGSDELIYPKAKRNKKISRNVIGGSTNHVTKIDTLMDHCYIKDTSSKHEDIKKKSDLLNDIEFDPVIKCETLNAESNDDNSTGLPEQKSMKSKKHDSVNRFYYYRNIIVGNISKYISLDKREKNDQSTHKWMVYVRGSKENPDVSDLVQKVVFFLHPSYIPHDIVAVNQTPFHLTRRGWGEFPVRLQIHFHDERNKPVDIIHLLKLDETYTGLQTLGCEKVIELRLHRHTVAEELASVLLSEISSTEGDILSNNCIETEVISMEVNPSRFYEKEDCERIKGIEISPIEEQKLDLTKNENSIKEVVCDERSTLIKVVSMFPLINSAADERLWYAAKSFDEYSKWPFFKRRAAEQQRAFTMKMYINEQGNKIPSQLEDYSTGKFWLWCRRHGFNPSELNGSVLKSPPDNAIVSCKLCGHYIGTKTSKMKRNKLCASCLSKKIIAVNESITEWTLPSSDDNFYPKTEINHSKVDSAPEEIIDISGSPERLVKQKHKYEIHSQPLDDWMYHTARNVNVTLDPHVYFECRGPVLQEMLGAALKSFVRDILSSSYSAAKGSSQSLQPISITTLHINQGIKSIPEFDFLTNEGLGVTYKKPDS